MGTKTTGKFCNSCNKQVMAQKNTPNHVLHLILTLITFGFWGIIWLLIALGGIGGYRCTQCGHSV